MNLKQLRAQNPSPTMVATLNYIEELSNVTGHDIYLWDIKEIFKGDGLEGITHSKTEINKIFFSKIKELKKEPVKVNLSEEIVSKILENEKIFKTLQRQNIESQIYTTSSQIEQLHNKIRIYQQTLKTQYESFKNLEISTLDHLAEILAGGFYEFHSTNNNSDPSIFLTTVPVTLVFRRADRDFRLPMGRYKIGWHIKDNYVTVVAFENNLSVQGYISPFVSSGNVCWGANAAQVSKYQSQGNVIEVFRTLQTLLTEYHSGSNPYASIEEFESNGTINLFPWKEWVANELKKEVESLKANEEKENEDVKQA